MIHQTSAVDGRCLRHSPRPRHDVFTRLAARNGERWPKLKAGIERARRDIAARGFAISIGEWQPDVNAVGVMRIQQDDRKR